MAGMPVRNSLGALGGNGFLNAGALHYFDPTSQSYKSKFGSEPQAAAEAPAPQADEPAPPPMPGPSPSPPEMPPPPQAAAPAPPPAALPMPGAPMADAGASSIDALMQIAPPVAEGYGIDPQTELDIPGGRFLPSSTSALSEIVRRSGRAY